jgi:hypothetical protein
MPMQKLEKREWASKPEVVQLEPRPPYFVEDYEFVGLEPALGDAIPPVETVDE